jgi:hypothetical protein
VFLLFFVPHGQYLDSLCSYSCFSHVHILVCYTIIPRVYLICSFALFFSPNYSVILFLWKVRFILGCNNFVLGVYSVCSSRYNFCPTWSVILFHVVFFAPSEDVIYSLGCNRFVPSEVANRFVCIVDF